MTAVPPGKRTTYEYAPLGSIKSPAPQVNIFAIVVSSSAPISISQDRILRDMILADETSSDFKFTLSYSSASAPPQDFFSPGTVVRFHRMSVSPGRVLGTFKGSGKASGTMFSWVFYTLDGSGGLVRRTASRQFTSSQADDDRACELIRWWRAKGHPVKPMAVKKGSQAPLAKLCDITMESGEVSCVAFVLDIKSYEQKKKHFELFLWDGSGNMIFEDTFDQSQMNFQLRPATKYKTYLGKYMRMSFWLVDKFYMNPIEPELQTMDVKTTYSILDPQTSSLVKEIIDDHDERVKKIVHSPEKRAAPQRICPSPLKKRRIPEDTRTSSSFPGSTEISTAKDVTTSAAPRRFHCKLRALSYWPPNASSFFRDVCSKCSCECEESSSCCSRCGGAYKRIVLLQLRLGDDSGTFDAILAGEEAEYFFTGKRSGELPNEELITASLDSILAGSCDATPNVDCQILSYINEDESRVCYALYDTTVTKLK